MPLLKTKNIIIFGVIVFLIMNFWSSYFMMSDWQGKMVNCPFMAGSSSFCQMNLFEHISQWKQLFTAVHGKSLLSFLSVLLIFLPIALLAADARAYNRLKLQWLRSHLYRYKPEIKLFDYLVVAFSQGIIHPEIYL